MDINVVVFVICAAIAIVVLLSVVAALNFIRKRQFSTHYKRIEDKDNEKPAFNFVVPTHVPKTVKLQEYGGDDVIDTAGGNVEAIDANLIDPELYKDVTKETKNISTITRGWLCFNVRYEPETQSLIVDLVRGEKIRQRKTSVSSSATPYVKVCLLPDKKKKLQTKTRQKTSNPLFNEQFIFSCPLFGLKERTLRFTVCDFDRFSRQSSVGRVLYPLLENYENILKEGGCEEIWREIEDCGNSEMENSCIIGEVLFSLQYLPAAKRVAISIIKGKGFGIESNTKKQSVHVKISMIVSGKTVHVRKTTKKSIIEPVFNESFHFDLHDDDSLEHTTLDVTVVINKDVIGQIFVGPSMYVTGTGLEHWQSMINSPRNAVAMWHTLS